MTPPTTAVADPALGERTDDDVRHRFEHLPWWRRPRRLSRQLAAALVTTALLAVATFGGLNYVAARELLVRGNQEQLMSVGAMRAVSIESGAQRLVAEISVASSDVFVAAALAQFSTAFAELDEQRLTARQRAELVDDYQQRIVDPLTDAGLSPRAAQDLIPQTPAGQWLQYHYTLRPADTPAPVDADDGTSYSQINAQLTPSMAEFSETVGGGDVLLIDDDGTIVYSLDKLSDFATNLVTGSYAGSALARTVTERLPITRAGATLLTDFTVSPTARPALWAVSAVSDETSVVGALAVEIPVQALNRLTTGVTDSDSGSLEVVDSYIVAQDLTLQSEPRAWAEDPEAYVSQLRAGDAEDQVAANLVELTGSPVGIQQIDTRPVRAAVDGEVFQGAAADIFGRATFAAAEQFTAGDRQWVVVTEMPRSTALAPLTAYVQRILLVLAIVLPIVAGLGIWLARGLTRPIRPTVEAAAAVVAGDRSPQLDTSRSDEFGDLARRLTARAAALGAHERQLADEYQRTRQLLLAVLPPRLVDADGHILGSGAAAARATVAAVGLVPTVAAQDPEHTGEILGRIARLAEQAAADEGLERVRMAADRFLFLAGMDDEGAGADAAIRFAARLRADLLDDGEDAFTLHVGLSTGAVGTGLLDGGALTFGAWGEPVRRALALAALAHVEAVLVDESTVRASAQPAAAFEAARDVVDLDGAPMALYRLTGVKR